MEIRKASEVIEELMKRGFCMTTDQFMRTTTIKVIKRYCININLDEAEFFELIRKIMDICHENDMKEMKIDYMNDNDWKDK